MSSVEAVSTENSPVSINAPELHTELLAATLKAAGDPLRLEILRLLARDSFGVLELARIFDTKQSGMSHHLKVLAQAGLVSTRREGNSIFYRRALPTTDTPQAALLIELFRTIDCATLTPNVAEQLRQIQRERASASEAFFADNAEKFREQQDLIASYSVYADAVAELLSHTALPSTQTALEVGPGEGEFLSILSLKFKRVLAVDTSASMLQKAKQRTTDNNLNNVEFVHGETTAPQLNGFKADCAIVNMVLHHTPSPAAIIQQISERLKSGGALLITELCHHDQQWAREACGDLWLGFEPDDLSNWASEAQFNEGQSQYMALRNGFQIQVRQFFKRS